MKKKYFLLLLCSCLLCCGLPTAAQVRGYILRNDSTYADGYLTNKQNYGFQVLFRPSLHGDDVAYGPDQLRGFGFGTVTYHTRQVMYNGKQEEVFLQLLESGELALYLLHTASRKVFYLEHQGQITEITEANLSELFSPYLSYCDALRNKLAYVSITKGELEKLTRMINRKHCSAFLSLAVGAVAKPTYSSAVINKATYTHNGQVPSLETGWVDAGIFVELPRLLTSGLSLGVEALYRYRKYEHAGTQPVGHDVMLVQSAVQLNLVPRYTFGSGKVRPFVEAGGVIVVDIDSRSQLTRRFYQGIVSGERILLTSKENDFLSLSDPGFGYLGAAGVQYMFRNNYNYVSLGIGATKIQYEDVRFDEMGLTLKLNL